MLRGSLIFVELLTFLTRTAITCDSSPVCRQLRMLSCSLIYVESIARVHRLSLSAKILYHLRMADSLLVQWPELQAAYPRTHCKGRVY